MNRVVNLKTELHFSSYLQVANISLEIISKEMPECGIFLSEEGIGNYVIEGNTVFTVQGRL